MDKKVDYFWSFSLIDLNYLKHINNPAGTIVAEPNFIPSNFGNGYDGGAFNWAICQVWSGKIEEGW